MPTRLTGPDAIRHWALGSGCTIFAHRAGEDIALHPSDVHALSEEEEWTAWCIAASIADAIALRLHDDPEQLAEPIGGTPLHHLAGDHFGGAETITGEPHHRRTRWTFHDGSAITMVEAHGKPRHWGIGCRGCFNLIDADDWTEGHSQQCTASPSQPLPAPASPSQPQPAPAP